MSILDAIKPKDLVDKVEAIAAKMKSKNVVANELRQKADALALDGMEPGDRRPWWTATIEYLQAQLEVCRVAVNYHAALGEQRRAHYMEAQAALLVIEDDLARDLGLTSRAELGISERHAWPAWIAVNRRITLTSGNFGGDAVRSSQDQSEKLEGQIRALEGKIAGDTKRRTQAAAEAKEVGPPESASEYLERTRKFR